jgi:hypothetical protein
MSRGRRRAVTSAGYPAVDDKPGHMGLTIATIVGTFNESRLVRLPPVPPGADPPARRDPGHRPVRSAYLWLRPSLLKGSLVRAR